MKSVRDIKMSVVIPSVHTTRAGTIRMGGNLIIRILRFFVLGVTILMLSGSISVMASQPLMGVKRLIEEFGINIENLIPSAPVLIITRPKDQINPAVAHISYTGEYLVAWEEVVSSTNHDIYVQWFDGSGVPTGLPIGVATTEKNETNPTVAYSPDTHRFLVVWEHWYSTSDHDIYARQVTACCLNPLIYISTHISYESTPSVAYNSAAQEYFVVWERRVGSGEFAQNDIYGRRVNAYGSITGELITVDNDASDESAPVVSNWEDTAWSGYLVAWQDKQTEYDIHAQQISQTGSLIGSEINVVTWQYDQIKPKLACAEKCLVVWEDHHWAWGAARDVYAQFYKLNSSGFLQSDGGNFPFGGPELRVNPVVYYRDCGDDYVVAWEYKTTTDNLGIYQRVVLNDRTLMGDEIAVSAESHYEGRPATATRVSCKSLLVWEDDRNSASTGIDIYGSTSLICSTHCSCPQNYLCYHGRCILDPIPVFCCARSGCPPGHWCMTIENTKSSCPEDPNYVCQTACDCGPAHCCKSNMCVKDIDDPWVPGGTEIGPPCEAGVDATYCCDEPECYAGNSAYGANASSSFRCYDLEMGNVRNYCGGNPCFGTACNCEPGDVCYDTVSNSSPGTTCFLLNGGNCISGALAEAGFGWKASEILSCDSSCESSSERDFGWLLDGLYAYQRLEGPCGQCGNGTCDPGEYPDSCPADCRCGDRQCAPSELDSCVVDCGICGDGACRDWESPFTCPKDCPALRGDGWCDFDEFWSWPEDCGCPDAPYFPQIVAVCGDDYFMGDFPLNPETCEGSCPGEYPPDSDLSNTSLSSTNQQVVFSRRYGGSLGPFLRYFAPDYATSLELANDAIYLTGGTYSTDFPIMLDEVGEESSHNLDWDAFVMKLDLSGNVIFSRYLGIDSGSGNDRDIGRDIAVDGNGKAFVAGSFGVVRVDSYGGNVTHFANSVYDTEGAYGIELDSSGNIYTVGSQDLGALKMNSAGSVSYHNTSLGGVAFDIAVDNARNAYVAGSMGLVVLDGLGATLHTTYLDGVGYGIAYNSGYIYVTGSTSSGWFPTTPGAFDTIYDPSGEAFVAKLDTAGNVLYATYLGGSGLESGRSVAVDSEGLIYVTGFTYSSDFPTSTNALDKTLSGIGDTFLTVINPSGNGAADLVYSTYIGGNDPAVPPYRTPERGLGIDLDGNGMVFLTGETGSADFATPLAPSSQSFTDLFLMKLDLPTDIYEINLPLVVK